MPSLVFIIRIQFCFDSTTEKKPKLSDNSDIDKEFPATSQEAEKLVSNTDRIVPNTAKHTPPHESVSKKMQKEHEDCAGDKMDASLHGHLAEEQAGKSQGKCVQR